MSRPTTAPNYIDYLESLSKTQLVLMLARARQEETQGLGVIGMGCRFPGGIDSPAAFWALLRRAGSVPMREAPTDSLGQPRWNPEAPDLTPVAPLLRTGAYLSGVDLFDAEYFGMSDEESQYVDPQQRLLLEVAVQALADANLRRADLRRRRVGIYVSVGFIEYGFAGLRNRVPADQVTMHMLQGSAASAASGRLGLMLGIDGPALTLDTASSSMLSVVHLAGAALRRRECDLALVGACHLLLSPFTTLMLSRAGALSPTGDSRPFGVGANGHVRGEGCGVFVLKRQADCVADHDRPYAFIRGSAVHQHGDRIALSVASAAGQKTVIDLALRNARVAPHEVQYVEAQANGSQLGGRVEAEALAEAYDRRRPGSPPLVVGSCKANLGYLEVASGAPALMKTALALSHGEIPPHPGADAPDPGIAWGALTLNAVPMAWPGDGRRLAGISGFGMDGINAHVIAEAPPPGTQAAPTEDELPALCVLSAHSDAALRATADRLRRHLQVTMDWHPAQVCRTLIEGRDLAKRRAVRVVHSAEQLLKHLTDVAEQGAPATPAGGTVGVFLSLPDARPPTDAELTALALCGPLHARLKSQAAVLGLPNLEEAAQADPAQAASFSLAWSLVCLDLLADLGITLQGCTAAGTARHLVLQRFTGVLSSAQACERWRAGQHGEAVAGDAWELTLAGERATIQPTSGRRGARDFAPTPSDVAGWLDLMAAQIAAGAELAGPAWYGPRRSSLMRLPGPVLIGKRHWPESLRWH